MAPTDLRLLVTGESGVGKEFFPQVIHAYSARKHNKYIAVNCGAIPEGTIDSELFGHEKGPSPEQSKPARVISRRRTAGRSFWTRWPSCLIRPRCGCCVCCRPASSSASVRPRCRRPTCAWWRRRIRICRMRSRRGVFREDLYYRLNTVPIQVPPLRERKEDIFLLFRKFAADVAAQYRMPAISLDPEARQMLENYYWRGNIRQLKNVAEQISAIEEARLITPAILTKYLPAQPQSGASTSMSTALHSGPGDGVSFERELLYKVLFDLRADAMT